MTIPQADRRFITAVEGVPASPSPISNAVVVGGTCWISGQLSVAEDGRYRPGTAFDEAERAFELVFRIAEAAGFGRGDIVYVDLAFQDLDDLAEVNQLYGPEPTPLSPEAISGCRHRTGAGFTLSGTERERRGHRTALQRVPAELSPDCDSTCPYRNGTLRPAERGKFS